MYLRPLNWPSSWTRARPFFLSSFGSFLAQNNTKARQITPRQTASLTSICSTSLKTSLCTAIIGQKQCHHQKQQALQWKERRTTRPRFLLISSSLLLLLVRDYCHAAVEYCARTEYPLSSVYECINPHDVRTPVNAIVIEISAAISNKIPTALRLVIVWWQVYCHLSINQLRQTIRIRLTE